MTVTVIENLAKQAVTTLNGVGPSLAKKLQKISIQSVQDLLFHLPMRYQDRSRITPLAHVQTGQEALIEAEVVNSREQFGRKRMLLVSLKDASGQVQLRFFHFNAAQKKQLSPGTTLRCFGEVRFSANGKEMVHPEYDVLQGDPPPLEKALTPVYPSTEGVSQHRLRQSISQALTILERGYALEELIPDRIRHDWQLMHLKEALLTVHRPSPEVSLSTLNNGESPAVQRLAFEELLAHHLSMLALREATRSRGAIALTTPKNLIKQFTDTLPFEATRAQQRVTQEIQQDLEQPVPSLRLVQGDVGCGKTWVAAVTALQAIAHGYQVALMAPTELLSEQHYANFVDWFQPLNITIAWLAGKIKGKKRQTLLSSIEQGEASLIIGTHALFQDEVKFNNLALVIIDEQHRFGVHQRLALREKGETNSEGQVAHHPHQIVMTATPIPRTLAMSAYADLDVSVIDELPPGRNPIETVVIEDQRRDSVMQRVAAACEAGQQAYWVCTLIEESENVQCEAAENTRDLLQAALPDLNVGLVHGRLKSDEKAQAMAAFKNGDTQLLVATTVIEVGVDVPNASLMIIENAERLGLAQLHQLRGRVGRGSKKSFCVLLYKNPLSRDGKERLRAMRESNDGFKIAEVDLKIRGPGELLGTRQTGEMQFRIADLMRDARYLDSIKAVANELYHQHPEQSKALINRWLHGREHYSQV